MLPVCSLPHTHTPQYDDPSNSKLPVSHEFCISCTWTRVNRVQSVWGSGSQNQQVFCKTTQKACLGLPICIDVFNWIFPISLYVHPYITLLLLPSRIISFSSSDPVFSVLSRLTIADPGFQISCLSKFVLHLSIHNYSKQYAPFPSFCTFAILACFAFSSFDIYSFISSGSSSQR